MDYARALEVATQAAAEAREILLAETRRPGGPRGTAGHCPADVEAERVIRARLTAAFPEWDYLGEETGRTSGRALDGHVWLVDPNDGTASMHTGYRGHAVSIGLVRDGVPVLGVVHAVNAPDDDGESFAWAEGCGPLLRNGTPVEREPWPEALGRHEIVLVSQAAPWYPAGNLRVVSPARFYAVPSIAYRLALVAAGEGCVAVSLNNPTAWDYAAGHALLRAVAGVLVDERGEEVRYWSDGTSSAQYCFGGGPAVAREVARRPWRTVTNERFGPVEPLPEFAPVRLDPGRKIHDPGVLRRAQGALLGQLAGDALGQLTEFATAAQIAAAYPDGGPRWLEDGGTWRTIAGQPTDDSEMALALARTLVHRGGFDEEAVAAAYARWYHGWVHSGHSQRCEHQYCRPFDCGNTIARALGGVGPDDLAQGRAAAQARAAASDWSIANGALMRVSPIGIWGWNRPVDEVAQAARADARLTHPNPVCQEASAVFAVTLAATIARGLGPEAAYAFALAWSAEHCQEAEVRRALRSAPTADPNDFRDQPGIAPVALANAFHQLLHAPTFEDGVIATVRLGSDTDTNAAICGALLGALQGRDVIPAQWRRMVLSCRPMPGHPGVEQPRPAMFWPTDALELAEALLLVGE